MNAPNRTEAWSSNFAFYLSVTGAAIGLGTLWRGWESDQQSVA